MEKPNADVKLILEINRLFKNVAKEKPIVHDPILHKPYELE